MYIISPYYLIQHLAPCIAQAQLLPLVRVGKVGSESGGANREGKMWD